MKPTRNPFVSTFLRNAVMSVTLASLATLQSVQAVSLYWDADGVTAGAGTAPTGTWGTSAFWSTNVAGTAATANTPTTVDDDLFFSAGTTAVNPFTVTLNGTQNARLLTIEEGTPSFPGGTINFGRTGGITLASAAGNLAITSNVTISGNQTLLLGTAAGANRDLTLSTGTFTRNALATLNVQSVSAASTFNSTQTNLSANNINTGIIGAWASFGAAANTRYATFTGSLIGGLIGTAAADGAALIDTVGTANYDLTLATGTVQPDVSANTIRYQGTTAGNTTLGATSFKVNGLMNSGPVALSPWTLASNTLTIGDDKELVVNTANNAISVSSIIQNNAGGASAVVKTGVNQLNLSGANTYTGITAISQGTLNIQSGGALGTTAGETTIAPTGAGTSARLFLSNNITCPENITLTGTAEANNFQGSIENSFDGSTNTLTGTITLIGTLGQRIGANTGTLNLEGPINREVGKSAVLTLRTAGNSTTSSVLNVKNGIDLNGGPLNYTGPFGTLILTALGSSHDIGNTTISVGGPASAVDTNNLTIKLGISNALPTNRSLTLGTGNADSTTNGGIFDLAGLDQTLTQILSGPADTKTVRRKVINSDSDPLKTSVLSLGNLNTSSTQFNGTIEGKVALTKIGTGTLTMPTSNPYEGATTINAGKLALTAVGTVGAQITASSVTINSGGTLEVKPAAATTVNNGIGSLTLNAGSSLTMVDGATNTFNVMNDANLSAGSAGIVPNCSFEIGGAVVSAKDTLAIGGAASFTNPGTKLSINPLSALNVGDSYTIATAASGLDSPNAWVLPANGRVSFAGVPYLLSLTNSPTQSIITVIPTGALAAYYTGDQGSTLNTNTSGNTNWSTTASGDVDLGGQPSAISDINFSSNFPANYEVTELGQNYTAFGLNFIDGPMTINDTAGRGFTIGSLVNVSTPSDVIVNVPLLGDAGLTKSGAGILTLGGNNGYLGTTNLNSGVTIFSGDNSAALGALNLAPSATLRVSGPNSFPAGVLTMGNTTSTTAPVLELNADVSTDFNKSLLLGAGPIGQNSNYTISVNSAGGGSGGTHTLESISQVNTVLRIITINSSTGYGLRIKNLNLAPSTGGFTQVTSFSVPVILDDVSNPMTGFNSFNFGTLSLNGGSAGSTIVGVIEDAVGGSIGAGGTTRLSKQGGGTWTLLAANTYTGLTDINGGRLVVNGSTSPLASFTVAAAGTLGGSGTVAGTVTSAGTIAPGSGVGTLTTGPVTLSGTLDVEIDGVNGDKLLSTGAIALSGPLTVNVLGGGFAQPSYVIAQGTSLTGTFSSVPAGYLVNYTATQAILSQTPGYGPWINSFTSIPLADRDPGDDPDSDGSSNLLEFALNGIPNNGSNNGLIASVIRDSSAPVGNDLSLVIAVRDGATFTGGPNGTQVATVSGITYSTQGSLNLDFPTSAVSVVGGASDTAPLSTGLPSLTGTDWEYQTFKLDASEGLGGKGFLRLNVTQP